MNKDIVKIIDKKINEIEVLQAKENVIKGIPEVKIRKLLGVIDLAPSTAQVNDSFNSVQYNMNSLVSRMNVSFKISCEILDIIKGLNKEYLAAFVDEAERIKQNNNRISQQQIEIERTIKVLENVVQKLYEFRDHVDTQLSEMCGKDWESDVKRQKEMLEYLEHKFNEYNNKFNEIDNEIKERVNPMLNILNQDGGELKIIKENIDSIKNDIEESSERFIEIENTFIDNEVKFTKSQNQIDELKERCKENESEISHSRDDIKVLKDLTDTHDKDLDNIHQAYLKLIDALEVQFKKNSIEYEQMRNDLSSMNYNFNTYCLNTNKEIKNIKTHLIILSITIAFTFIFLLVIFILLLCGIF